MTKLNLRDVNMLQYLILNQQVDILDKVSFESFSTQLNDVSIGLSVLYKKLDLIKKELKNGYKPIKRK